MIEWSVLWLTAKLAAITALITIPIGIALGRWRVFTARRWASWVDVLILLPLLLPPTVIGYYFLLAFSGTAWVFSFWGIAIASVFVNIPFAIFPIRRTWEQIPRSTLETAACCGWSPWRVFWRCELPQGWPGIVSALALVAAHTVGEFGVVMMVGGNLAGETRTLAVAVYDHVQAQVWHAAHGLALIAIGFGVVVAIAAQRLARPIQL